MICPQCRGTKTTGVFACPGFRSVTITCGACNGTGQVDDHYPRWRERGQAMRTARLAREPYENQDAAACQLGLDVVTYSRMEAGYIEPLC